jgi:hypothetical protein
MASNAIETSERPRFELTLTLPDHDDRHCIAVSPAVNEIARRLRETDLDDQAIAFLMWTLWVRR